MNTLVEDNPAQRRFEILVDDSLAGVMNYELRGETVVVTHTEVDEHFRDAGVGTTLVRGSLDQIRARGNRVVPRCPFVAAFIDRNPEYRDLLAD